MCSFGHKHGRHGSPRAHIEGHEATGARKVFKYLPGLQDLVTISKMGSEDKHRFPYISELPIYRPGGLVLSFCITRRYSFPKQFRKGSGVQL